MTTRFASPPPVYVVDAAAAAASDAAAIAGGIPSRALMQRAGAAAAAEIARHHRRELASGVVIATGPGNNGGDGWVVAAALHAVGVRVRVVECEAARTPDAQAERDTALAAGVAATALVSDIAIGGERIAVDALLGTGFRAGTPLRGKIADAVAELLFIADRGGSVVALDVPTGLDATTGAHEGAPQCALTLTFGTVKRGTLVARERCGAIHALDIGLGLHASAVKGDVLATPEWFNAHLPPIPADAHKGTRKKVVVLGGASGMAGAAMLAARGALRSGAGMVKCVVAPDSVSAIQEGEPAALAAAWPTDDASFERTITQWADVVLVGPGLGRDGAREMVERLLGAWHGPVVLDADALNAFAGDADALAPMLGGRSSILTPHPTEFARLIGSDVDSVLADRFTLPSALAHRTTATVLLKGTPTVVAGRDSHAMIIAEGTPVLATGGSGDVLGGIVATLLAQTSEPTTAAALAAFAHGRASTSVSARQVRGYTLDDVLDALPAVWAPAMPHPRPPVLAQLPAVGEA
ncbi:MAG: NAD(P)H-hydrate dehydratase [Gemmatimonadaceae bacterium]